MAKPNRIARRAALLASLAVVAVAATAVPLKSAAADDWRYNGHGRGGYGHDWRGGGYGHDWHGGYNGGYRGGYYPQGGVSFFYSAPPAYYYPPAPVYYAPPPPVYYPPAPVYGPPGISLDFVIPLHFR